MLTFRPLRLLLLGALALATVSGCGDDDDERPRYRATVTTNNDDGTTIQVSSLEDDELEEVCASYSAFVDTHISFDALAYFWCLPQAIVLGGSAEGCEERLLTCIDDFPEPIELGAQSTGTEICLSQLRSCNASVAEFEGCVNLNLDLVFDIFDNWSCGGNNDDQIRDAARAMDRLSICADIDASCAEAAGLRPE